MRDENDENDLFDGLTLVGEVSIETDEKDRETILETLQQRIDDLQYALEAKLPEDHPQRRIVRLELRTLRLARENIQEQREKNRELQSFDGPS